MTLAVAVLLAIGFVVFLVVRDEIAEPWDVGPGGYQVGNFPPNWTEWNGKYRDTVRDFWRGEPATLAEFASRITGSADLYQDDGRKPFHSAQRTGKLPTW